jgi:uncharacterized membrane protein
MNYPYIHLILNHMPIVSNLIGILLLLCGMLRKNTEWKKAAVGIFIFSALISIPTYLTGEPSEHAIEHLPGVSKDDIHEHEEAAEFAFVGVLILGALSLFGSFLSWKQGSYPGWFIPAVLLLALLVGAMMARTANLGGKIRHPEIRNGATAPPEADED